MLFEDVWSRALNLPARSSVVICAYAPPFERTDLPLIWNRFMTMLLLLVGVMALNFATTRVLSGFTIRRRNRGRFLSVSSIP